jgi:hypothetical protein
MKGLELLEKNPNIAKLICSYYLEIMLESLKDEGLPEEFKDSVREQGIDNYKIAVIIESNPRNLFDFFDDHELYIEITTNVDGSFRYSILGDIAKVGSTKTYNTRKEAESEAIEQAIKQLESLLTKSVIDKENS